MTHLQKFRLPALIFAVCLSLGLVRGNAYADTTITFGTSQNDWQNVGQASTWQQQAVKFTTSEVDTGATASFSIKKNGSPTDNLTVSIETDAAGQPSGTVLGTAQIAAGSVPNSCGSPVTFPTISSISLSAGTSYWVVFSRSGGLDNSNSYGICFTDNSDPPYTYVFNGSVWSIMPTFDASYHGYIYGSLALTAGSPPPPPLPPQMFTATSSCSTIATSTPAAVGSTTWSTIATSTCGILYGVIEIDWTQINITLGVFLAFATFIFIVWLFKGQKRI